MKALFQAIFLGLMLFADLTHAATTEKEQARCQQLAQDFAEDPYSITMVRLRQLQFCINQTVAQRETRNPPTTLKGTIIEPLSSSESEPSSIPPEVRIGD
ncbi:hypothetical protein [Candidatus Nitrospira salsa]